LVALEVEGVVDAELFPDLKYSTMLTVWVNHSHLKYIYYPIHSKSLLI
jgi:hypothetical protein